MKLPANILVGLALVLAVIGALALKNNKPATTANNEGSSISSNSSGAVSVPKAGVPRLVDLGSSQCIPCKMMAPILEELRKEYAGKLEVEFLDVKLMPELGKVYNIKLIPTQIFLDANGKELFRHEGFFSKDDILAKWKELGIVLKQ